MKRLILSICAVTAIAVQASAQMTLTVEDAVNIALSENPTIKVAELEVQRYDYVKRETWGNLLPQVSASGQYTRSIVKQEMAKGISFGADNTLTATGNVSLPLFAPTVYRTLKMNRTQLASAVEAARASRINLVAEVKKAFYNIQLAEQSLSVLLESEKTIKRTVDDTKSKFDNGLASEYDLLTAQVQLSNLQPTIVESRNSIEVSKLLLKMYLSIPENVVVEVSGNLDSMRDAVVDASSLSTDISGNTSLRSLDLQVELLERQLKLNNASRLPTLSAFGTVTLTGNDMGKFSFGEDGTAAAATSNPFYWQHPVSAGLQLSVPIFSGLTKSSKARQIKNNMAQVRLQRDYAVRSTTVELQTSINNLIAARETMYAQEQTVAQAVKAYAISDTRYRAGAGTILELNSAQLSMTQAQLSFSQAIYNYLSAKADYDKVIGVEK